MASYETDVYLGSKVPVVDLRLGGAMKAPSFRGRSVMKALGKRAGPSAKRDFLNVSDALWGNLTDGEMRFKDQVWRMRFEELRAYKMEHGHTHIPYKSVQLGHLGRWVTTQRTFYRLGLMPRDRIELLEGIGFRWDVHEVLWEAHFEQLLLYRINHGHCLVPYRNGTQHKKQQAKSSAGVRKKRGPAQRQDSDPETVIDLDLGAWVNNQRALKRSGKITTERERRLEEAGFVFEVADCTWSNALLELCRFRQTHGHAHFPGRMQCEPDEIQLCNWITMQRSMYKKRRLQADRIEKLESLGFHWKSTSREMWETRMKEAISLRSLNAEPQDDHSLDVAKRRVARWVSRQRNKLRAGVLTSNRFRRLVQEGLLSADDLHSQVKLGRPSSKK